MNNNKKTLVHLKSEYKKVGKCWLAGLQREWNDTYNDTYFNPGELIH
jgi:hypothetical protein